ncbi:hypothetical protein DFH08DRAFT_1040571 [Mycena albidolilacea]|uniref:Uncharacterized protein n=1 Tax=Mycena albidolilacea TaxID=1033008 RepID=A0AAD7EEM4_9AGAR|nr:hypothetical protein DFH08DRAFT_1040571 [Mycena albidolilacea]
MSSGQTGSTRSPLTVKFAVIDDEGGRRLLGTTSYSQCAPPSILAIFALPHICLANWSPGKGAQVNFYTDTQCTAYNGEVAAWWNQAQPLVGVAGSGATQAQFITLNMLGNSLSINTAALWGFSTATEPARGSGFCTLWDGFGCTENTVPSYYNTTGQPDCQPSRSTAGFLWKSANCWLI